MKATNMNLNEVLRTILVDPDKPDPNLVFLQCQIGNVVIAHPDQAIRCNEIRTTRSYTNNELLGRINIWHSCFLKGAVTYRLVALYKWKIYHFVFKIIKIITFINIFLAANWSIYRQTIYQLKRLYRCVYRDGRDRLELRLKGCFAALRHRLPLRW